MSSQWFKLFKKQGTVARQAHFDLPKDSYEREMGKEGFFGPVTHFYHRHKHTGWIDFEGDNRPRAFDTNELEDVQTSPWQAPVLLRNKSTQIRMMHMQESMTRLVRNADGDELLFFIRHGPFVL
jgi:homogentisate 1,2-dioxygenase (EC 1.13.11.5)